MLLRSKLERLITLLGITGFIVAILFSQRVFPSAAIDLNVPRQTIYQTAQTYLKTQNQNDFSQYQSIQRFSEDWMASIYLQQTLGIADTNRLIKDEKLPIYYWGLRWFQPSQQEEFYVSVSTTGDVIGYHHTVPETAPGAQLTIESAQTIAETYLRNEQGWNLTDWDSLDNSTAQRPNRTDHTFQWKRKDWSLDGSELRMSVTVQGDEIGSYGYWLKIPEAFAREYRETRNLARFFYVNTSSILRNGSLCVACLFYLIAIARGQINWRSGLIPAFIVLAVSLLSQWNTLPLAKNYYSTTENYYLFWIQAGFDSLFNAVVRAIPIYFLWIGGQQLAKRVWPQQDMILPRHPNRIATFTQSYWRGLMLAGIRMAYMVVFYFIATHVLHAWSPMKVDYSNLFSTPIPFMSSLRGGILPAIGEELEARLIGIGILLLLFRHRWLALIIPGGIWAFAHLGYVSEPFYLRGIELWVPAIFLYGLFFLRFGLLTTMVGHCTYNSLLGAMLLLKAQDTYLVFSGILVIAILLLPLVPGLWHQGQRPKEWHDALHKERLQPVPATAEDYEQICSLPLGKVTLPKQSDNNWFPSDYEIICLKSSDSIEGVSIAKLESSTTAVIQTVYVKPKYRRCYYGSQLIDVLVARLKQRGVMQVSAIAKTASPQEKRFWANQNWKIVHNVLQARG
ncbi:GNAT family N-acetyltransferase [Leptothoe spongobia]|uniref:GNAT family N-acetyltransferase n=1 Tax=Leptothoe spongobia TAU-MAC 1115 TaxID=1967444 RepID=A0A947GGZ1_9CYAN|nr:GNAT family N-acetyltransferase [Leptothoe spongobia]MBT9314649.1 GNAT family N-acetyltransferase [Leptothoe spongobia TAU-MAC 1115]